MRVDVKGYEGLYQVDELGNVYSCKKSELEKMRPTDNGGGYMRLSLYKNHKYKVAYVHRIVAEAFCQREDGQNYVDHIDGNKRNNSATNLRWCTQKENILWSRENGLQNNIKVICTKISDGETKVFSSIKEASKSLFGSENVLRRSRWVDKYRCIKKGWEIKVAT